MHPYNNNCGCRVAWRAFRNSSSWIDDKHQNREPLLSPSTVAALLFLGSSMNLEEAGVCTEICIGIIYFKKAELKTSGTPGYCKHLCNVCMRLYRVSNSTFDFSQ